MVRVSRKDVVILTAGHVCETEGLVSEDRKYKYSWTSIIKLLDRNRQFHDAQIILSTPGTAGQSADLCTLFAPSLDHIKNKSKVTIASRAPTTGEDIYYIGAPHGIYHPPTALVVRGTYSGPVDKYSSLIAASAAPGASGSAVLSLNNQIYGVLFAVHPNFQTATIITSYSETKKFLEATRILLKE